MVDVVSVNLFEVREMEQVPRRPWKFEPTERQFREFSNTYSSHTIGQGVTSVGISKAFSNAFQVTKEKYEDITDTIRFKDPHFAFIIEIMEIDVDDYDSNGRGLRTFLTGYTDRVSVRDDQVDDNTTFHINSVIQVRDIFRDGRLSTTVTRNVQLLNGAYDPSQRGGNEYLSRPEDIYSAISMKKEYGERSRDYVDGRRMFDEGSKLSRRSSNVGSTMLTSLINAEIQAHHGARMHPSDAEFSGSREVRASDALREQSFTMVTSLELLESASQDDVSENGSFRYSDLVELTRGRSMRDLDDRTKYAMFEDNDVDYSGERWTGADAATIKAVTACHAIPSLMVQCLMQTVEFEINNIDSHDNRIEMEVLDMYSFVGKDFDDESIIDAFKSLFIAEVFDAISDNGRDEVELRVSCDLDDVVSLDIGINGGHMERFIFPTFADGTLVPTMSDSADATYAVADKYLDVRKVLGSMLAQRDIDDERRDRNGRDRDRDYDRGDRRGTSETPISSLVSSVFGRR